MCFQVLINSNTYKMTQEIICALLATKLYKNLYTHKILNLSQRIYFCFSSFRQYLFTRITTMADIV